MAAQPIRIQLGPAPQAGKVRAVVGLAKRGFVAGVRLQATLNGHPPAPGQNVATTDFAGLPARGVCFACPRDAVNSGCNELAVRAAGDPVSHQPFWVELRVEPE